MNQTEHLVVLLLGGQGGRSGRRCGRCARPISPDDRYGTIEAVCAWCRGDAGPARRPEHRRAAITRIADRLRGR